MVDFRELGIKKFVEGSGLGDEDFEVIGKIYNLASDSLVSKIVEKDFNYDFTSFYEIYLNGTMREKDISGFLGDHKLRIDRRDSSYFVIETDDREYHLEFFDKNSEVCKDYDTCRDDEASDEGVPF